ncbi:uncharacterized protein LOC124326569 [Daphnia pulicaria]|uniref:uncharacterized protein LOC124326569 n=1 Tax=Daphnia pulicaria TaxID=35523 RepID=UPI001EEAE005|nr:uncharacterized protein LOC124326569 [Daphnia pulicaria]
MDEQLQCTLPNCILRRIISTQSVDDGVVLLPFVVSLKAGSITGVQCLLGMVDTKAPHRRLTTQRQHSHQPVTTLRPTITTSPRFQNITPQLTLPQATSSKILSTTLRLPSTTPPSHRSTTRMLPQLTMYTEIPKNYIVPSYYTEAPTYYSIKAAEYYTESPNYYTNKTPDYYTTTYASPSH